MCKRCCINKVELIWMFFREWPIGGRVLLLLDNDTRKYAYEKEKVTFLFQYIDFPPLTLDSEVQSWKTDKTNKDMSWIPTFLWNCCQWSFTAGLRKAAACGEHWERFYWFWCQPGLCELNPWTQNLLSKHRSTLIWERWVWNQAFLSHNEASSMACLCWDFCSGPN